MDRPEPNVESIYLPCRFDELVSKDLTDSDDKHIKEIEKVNNAGRDCWNSDATMKKIKAGVVSDRTLLLLGSFKPQASSFILATNCFGDFSKSSAITKLIDGERLQKLGTECRAVWQQFVHQPQTARCLVFYVVLGDLCAQIAEQYQNANRAIKDTLRLDKVFNQKDKLWAKDKAAVDTFKLGLWTLESFYRLRHSLRESIESVAEARGTLNAQIKEAPGARSEPLEEECQQHLEVFENKFAGLTAVAVELEESIELNVRYKEAFEAVLTLDDSRASLEQSETSLKQNVTIQKLTYLTIGYLPLGLTAAIFAIPDEQKVVAQPMGLGWFVGGILLLMLVTYVLAYNLTHIMKFFEGTWRQLRQVIPNLHRYFQDKGQKWMEKKKEKKARKDVEVGKT